MFLSNRFFSIIQSNKLFYCKYINFYVLLDAKLKSTHSLYARATGQNCTVSDYGVAGCGKVRFSFSLLAGPPLFNFNLMLTRPVVGFWSLYSSVITRISHLIYHESNNSSNSLDIYFDIANLEK